jgi:MFS family permease
MISGHTGRMRATAPSAVPVGGAVVTSRFVVVTAATLAYFVAVGIGLPTLPRFVKDGLGGTNVDVGLTVAAYGVAAVACRPLLSWTAQRVGQRRLMLLGAGVGSLAYLGHMVVASMPPLLALRAVMGVAEAFLFVGAATIVNELAPAHRRAEATSYFSVAVFSGLGLGPLIGEHFAGDGRFDAAFLAAAAVAAVAFAITLVLQRPLPSLDRRAPAGGPRPPLLHPRGLRGGVVLAASMAGYAGWATFLPLRADEVGVSAGLLFGLYALLVLVLRVAGAKIPERVGLGRCAGAAIVLITTGLLLMWATPGALGLWAGTVVLGLGIALLYPSLMALTLLGVDDARERAAVVATFTMFFEVGAAVGGILLGGVAALSGYRGAFAAGALVAGSGAVLLWTLVLAPRRALVAVGAAAEP